MEGVEFWLRKRGLVGIARARGYSDLCEIWLTGLRPLRLLFKTFGWEVVVVKLGGNEENKKISRGEEPRFWYPTLTGRQSRVNDAGQSFIPRKNFPRTW